MTTTPQSSVPSAPTREEVEKIVARHGLDHGHLEDRPDDRLRTLSADHARLVEQIRRRDELNIELSAERDRLSAQLSALRQLSAQGVERTAQLIAHRVGWADESDARGNLHGMCVVCGVPWPCAYAGEPPPKENVAAQSERIAALDKDAARYRWLRNFVYETGSGEHKIQGFDPMQDNLDEAIDAARLDASGGIERIEPESPLCRQEDGA